jgi:predicted nucleic acid-binding protein
LIRSGAYEGELVEALHAGRLYLSSLVGLELYAGTRDQAEKRALDTLVASFRRRGFMVTPSEDDHLLAGILLSRQRRLTGDLQVRDHVVDLLIVLSTSQLTGTVLTANVRHLAQWAALARRAGRDVRVREPAL